MKDRFSQFYKGTALLEWLEPPASFGALTIYELWENENSHIHFALADKWARPVWKAWNHQHDRIKYLLQQIR